MALPNGHSVEASAELPQPPLPRTRSDSDLSDLNDIPTTTISPSAGPADEAPSDDDAIHDMATSELEEDEDAPGEEDADFDDEAPAPGHADRMDIDASSSESGARHGRRKAEVDDEELMKQNPELYGLRRSVSMDTAGRSIQILTYPSQGRARPTRRVVRAQQRNTPTIVDANGDSRSIVPMKTRTMREKSTPAGGGNAKNSPAADPVCHPPPY